MQALRSRRSECGTAWWSQCRSHSLAPVLPRGVSRQRRPGAGGRSGYRRSGQRKADLNWNGVAGTSYDVYRNATKIATVQATAHTDAVGTGTGGYTYRVCDTASATCSNDATVSF